MAPLSYFISTCSVPLQGHAGDDSIELHHPSSLKLKEEAEPGERERMLGGARQSGGLRRKQDYLCSMETEGDLCDSPVAPDSAESEGSRGGSCFPKSFKDQINST